MKKHLVLAVDFDGTCVEHAFPEIGPDMPHAVEVLRELARRGHKLVLWTCREDHATKIDKRHLSAARIWFSFRNIPLRSVNETHPEDEFRDHEGPIGRGRKVYADICIDDRNLGGFPGWKAVLAEVDRLTGGTA